MYLESVNESQEIQMHETSNDVCMALGWRQGGWEGSLRVEGMGCIEGGKGVGWRGGGRNIKLHETSNNICMALGWRSPSESNLHLNTDIDN